MEGFRSQPSADCFDCPASETDAVDAGRSGQCDMLTECIPIDGEEGSDKWRRREFLKSHNLALIGDGNAKFCHTSDGRGLNVGG